MPAMPYLVPEFVSVAAKNSVPHSGVHFPLFLLGFVHSRIFRFFIKNLGRNPPSQTPPPQGTPDPRKFFMFGEQRATERISRAGGLGGPKILYAEFLRVPFFAPERTIHRPAPVQNFLCRKKWGPKRKDFGGGYGFPGFYRVSISTTGLESSSSRPEKFSKRLSFGGGCVRFFLLCLLFNYLLRFRGFQRSSQRPSERQISLSEALSPVAPICVAP